MQTRGIGHQAQHGHGDVGEKSDARFRGHRSCIATPLPGAHGLEQVLVRKFQSLGHESNWQHIVDCCMLFYIVVVVFILLYVVENLIVTTVWKQELKQHLGKMEFRNAPNLAMNMYGLCFHQTVWVEKNTHSFAIWDTVFGIGWICFFFLILTGWWFFNPSEKYERQLGWLFPIYGENKKWQLNHQPVNIVNYT